jgi:NADPH-dependent 2,4-dienoyl-CoA reductase/sulfur reductase-like enzyme
MSRTPIVIVGMGLAGTRCATTLRRLVPGRPVVLIGDERHDPYERPPLSKELLARTREASDLVLPGARHDQLRTLGIDVRAGSTVVGIDQGAVVVGDGTRIDASAIVLATGARPRLLATPLDPARLHVLRSLDDAVRLRDALVPGRRLAIVGSGFIGAEVASTARAAGVDVTVIEAESAPFARSLGADVGTWLADRWRAAGVDLRLSCGVVELGRGTDAPVRIGLVDGTSVDADDVLVAIGTIPRDELFHAAFAGCGTPGTGIAVDPAGRTEVPGIWAAGDVALVDTGHGRLARRIEHWTDASSAAIRVARDIAGADAPARSAPYAWSDQFGVRLQVVGHPAGSLATELDDRTSDTLLARYVDPSGQLRGIAAVGRTADVARYRGELAA